MSRDRANATAILGIDPGLTGALALFEPHTQNITVLADMPKIKVGSRSTLDHKELASFVELYADTIKFCVVEDVGAAPDQGVVSMFTFGKVTGIAIGVVAAHHIPIFFIKPSIWKFQLGLTSDKALSLKRAKKLWPAHAAAFARNQDDGRAEACLLAKFGERFFDIS